MKGRGKRNNNFLIKARIVDLKKLKQKKKNHRFSRLQVQNVFKTFNAN